VDSVTADFKTDAHPTRFEESYIDAAYHYYKWTGDLESIRQLYSTLVGAAKWLDANLDPDGDNLYKDTMHQWKSDFDERGPSSTFETALVRKAYADLAEIATKLGKPEDAAKFQAKSEAIMHAAQRELWSNEFAMLGPKCPLGLLRLHPQSLEM
jgi:glycogen debranching enzyme